VLLPGPDTRVVELRVHGIMGTRPEALVSAAAAVDVAGDGVGRIVRPADRLLRPAGGPMLPAEGRTVPRVVEGYVWGGMTSGGLAKAAWALLFPFSLANVAHWMLPPVPAGHRFGRRLAQANRSLLRLAALLLTMLLVTQAAVLTLDLVAAQCLAPGTGCLGWVPERARRADAVRLAVGLLPVLFAIGVLYRVSCVAWEVRDAANPPPTPPNLGVHLPGANLVADPDTPTLRVLHAVAALAVVALLPVGGPFTVPAGTAAVPWLVAVLLLVGCLLGVLLLDDPRGADPQRAGRWLRAGLGPRMRAVLLGVGVALVPASAVLGPALPTVAASLPGTTRTVEAVAAVLLVVCVLFAVLLVVAALIARPAWAARPRPLRPWAGGWMAAPVLMVAALLGGGFGAGLAITVSGLIGADGVVLPKGYEPVTLLWGAAAVLGVLVGLPVLGWLVLLGWRVGQARHPVPMVSLLHRDRPVGEEAVAARGWRKAGVQRANLHRVLLAVAGVLVAGAAVALVARLRGVAAPDWLRPLSTVGVLALGLLAGSLLRVVYTAARRPEAGRHLGVLADIASFWPREAHPTVPPCYPLKVVPELAARAREHLRDPGVRVVLTGHSQGALLVAVATARLLDSLNEPDRRRVGMVTVAAPLQWAYSRAFPAVVPHESLARLTGELGTRWRSLCRGTDPLGGASSTWRRQVVGDELVGVGYRPDGTIGPLPPAARTPSGALVLGGDHWLPDPQRGPVPGRRWTPGIRGHADYTADPEWDRAVAMAAGLDPTGPGDQLRSH